MLYWAFIFFVIAIVAALFGFGGITSAAVGLAKVLFYICIFFFAISLIARLITKKKGRIS